MERTLNSVDTEVTRICFPAPPTKCSVFKNTHHVADKTNLTRRAELNNKRILKMDNEVVASTEKRSLALSIYSTFSSSLPTMFASTCCNMYSTSEEEF